MSDEILQAVVDDNVAWLTFNRPEKLNAINRALTAQAIEHLRRWALDPEIGAVVVTGAGRAFCAGGDVSDMAARADKAATMEGSIDQLRAGHEMCWLLHSMPKVTIAAVNGFAMGAGLGIAMCCDLRIASDQAKFGTAYARVGFGGDYGTTWKLTHLVGQAKAKELMFLADIIDAAEAHRIGLVNRVVPHGTLEAAVKDVAGKLAHGPRVSFRYMKENINLAVHSDFRSILDREAMTHIRCGETEDHKEGALAFVEKRAPLFKGR
jgi:2-(1,2-epoxy-1,2-dihydrophenyl)acetyl-CoA isomerase